MKEEMEEKSVNWIIKNLIDKQKSQRVKKLKRWLKKLPNQLKKPRRQQKSYKLPPTQNFLTLSFALLMASEQLGEQDTHG